MCLKGGFSKGGGKILMPTKVNMIIICVNKESGKTSIRTDN